MAIGSNMKAGSAMKWSDRIIPQYFISRWLARQTEGGTMMVVETAPRFDISEVFMPELASFYGIKVMMYTLDNKKHRKSNSLLRRRYESYGGIWILIGSGCVIESD